MSDENVNQTQSENVYEFTYLSLDENEFNSLIFHRWSKGNDIHDELICDIELKPMEYVVSKIRERYPDVVSSSEMFNELYNNHPIHNFYHCGLLNRCFSPQFISNSNRIWIKNTIVDTTLVDHENIKYIIEDGNHRSLVYAMKIMLGELNYQPIQAIHATSWDICSGVLGYHACNLMNKKNYNYGIISECDRKLVSQFDLPNGIIIRNYHQNKNKGV